MRRIFVSKRILEDWLRENEEMRRQLWEKLADLSEDDPLRLSIRDLIRNLLKDYEEVQERIRRGVYILVED